MHVRPDDQLTIISKRTCREIAKMQLALEAIAASAGTGVIANLARTGLDLPPHPEVWTRMLGQLKHLDAYLNKIAAMDDRGDLIDRHCIAIAKRERFSDGLAA